MTNSKSSSHGNDYQYFGSFQVPILSKEIIFHFMEFQNNHNMILLVSAVFLVVNGAFDNGRCFWMDD